VHNECTSDQDKDQRFGWTEWEAFGRPALSDFGGASAKTATLQRTTFETITNNDGMAELAFDSTKTSWIQVWADGLTLCQNKPNFQSFSVEIILEKGVSAPNTCSSVATTDRPGQFTVFARTASLKEKMNR
jgi:hypothetical protein